MEPAAINWWQTFIQALFIVLPLLGGGFLAYKRLWWTLSEHRPHTHGEKHGNLTVDGIRFPRSMNGK